MKPGSNSRQLPLEVSEEDMEEKQEATASLARSKAAKETTVDAAVVAVLSQFGGSAALNEKRKAALVDFLDWKHVFSLLLLLFLKCLVKTYKANFIPRANWKPRAVQTWLN